MGFGIYIGNAEVEYHVEGDDSYVEVTVNKVVSPDAPHFPGDDMTGKSNGRHPGYGQWGKFLRSVDLYDLFFDKDHGLMRSHPGCEVLLPSHIEVVETERKRYQEAHPNAVPGWCGCKKCDLFKRESGKEHIEMDGALPRILWMEWWMKWARANCERPAIHNH